VPLPLPLRSRASGDATLMPDARPTSRWPDAVDFGRASLFLGLHLMPLGALWTTVRAADWWLCLALYFGRMWFVTAGLHRYFSHRSYKTGRVFQFVLAFGALTCAQRSVMWWAACHRHHHKHSDEKEDLHSPKDGFWWSHVVWVFQRRAREADLEMVPDLRRYPELVWLDRLQLLPATLLAAAVYWWGGPSALFIGFFLSTVFLYHGTFTINSLAHVFGRRRYATTDTSRNSFLLSLLTLGEGWHNNHHYYQRSERQGFYWWELDLTHYVLVVLSWFRIVHGLRGVPATVREARPEPPRPVAT
jgi:stearoyl-CoA desaturase (delta-9 desaturase)